MYFSGLGDAPLDPIMALDQQYREDPSPDKVNLVVGVYQTEDGHTPIFDVVKEAERRIAEQETTKTYLPMAGDSAFHEALHGLLFGDGDASPAAEGRVASMHVPGGTAALRVAAEFLLAARPGAAVWMSDPGYPNHRGIFGGVGLPLKTYRYYDVPSGRLMLSEMLEDLAAAEAGDAVILHGCCHNPTGADPDPDAWGRIARFVAERGMVPIVDSAYLGFAHGLQDDPSGLRTVFDICREGVLATSFSKNLGLYGERVGAVSFVAESPVDARRCLDTAKLIVRRFYSSPPMHGGRIVSTVANDPQLQARWVEELRAIRTRLRALREAFAEGLQAHRIDPGLAPGLLDNVGMFVLTMLSKGHVERLRKRHHIYVLPNGRISIAGMRRRTMDNLCAGLAEVLRYEPL